MAHGTDVEKLYDRSAGKLMLPVVGENGLVAAKVTIANIERIMLYDYMDNMKLVDHIISTDPDAGQLFSKLGHPAISDDGQIIVFYGDLTTAGAEKYNNEQADLTYTSGMTLTLEPLTVGPGIFASIETAAGRMLQPVVNSDHEFDSLDAEMRPSISNIHPDQQLASLFFVATKNGQKGVYFGGLKFSGLPPQPLELKMPAGISPADTTLVVQQGQVIEGLSGSVQEMRLYDSIKNATQRVIAFWLDMGGSEAIVRYGRVTRIQAVDLYPDLLTENGNLVTDPETLATKGTLRVGIATDGVSKVLLRTLDQGLA